MVPCPWPFTSDMVPHEKNGINTKQTQEKNYFVEFSMLQEM
jgi:hypothetical protein